MEGFSNVQRGSVGDITAGIPLEPWTDEIVRTLMAQNERAWDEAGIPGAEREERRKEWSDRYRAHIVAKDLFYAYVDYPVHRVVFRCERQGSARTGLLASGGYRRRQLAGKESPEELADDERKRQTAMANHLASLTKAFSEENRKNGGDGNVFGVVIR